MSGEQLEGLSQAALKDWAGRYDTFIFDCDGVVWVGDRLISGSDSTLKMLRDMGKRLIFVTNNSTKTREAFNKKFVNFGIEVDADSLWSSARALVDFLVAKGLVGKKVYLVGSPALHTSVKAAGVDVIGGDCDLDKGFRDCAGLTEDMAANPVAAVAVGFDGYINFYKLTKAAGYVRGNDTLFVCTNKDVASPLLSGDPLLVPGCGATMAAIEAACGREALCVGKPSQDLAQLLIERYGLDPSRTCMVGDRLDTDILFGRLAGMATLLVHSGVTSPEMVAQLRLGETLPGGRAQPCPDFTAPSLATLLGCL